MRSSGGPSDRAGAAAVAAVGTVGVVVPTLDEAATISACLESVGCVDTVVAVVSDGGSRDATLAIVRERFPSVRVVEGPPGRGGQLNRGAADLATDALLFLHADCRLPPRWLPEIRQALTGKNVALGCFRLHTEPPQGRRSGLLARGWWRLLDLRSQGLGLPYGDQALFVRRDLFGAVGGFPEVPLMEDVAFARRCLTRGRLARVSLEVRTTARRFARHPVRARACTLTFPLLFRLGVSPHRLARWYGNVR
jgi:rSAM/selenodomain-associated transferase 2